MELVTSTAIQAGNLELQDRVAILRYDDRVIFAVADGAGGISGGAQAAELFMLVVRESAASLIAPENCVYLLHRIDQDLVKASECGETTGVVAVIEGNRIFGASVGDSMAWAFSSKERVELTGGQQRKPFLGTGVALARPFARALSQGTIVFGTDGLWKYSGLESIEQRVREADPTVLANELCELVRLRSGTFPDDVAVITCRSTE
jgi:serine/threonine protein phosphatase PrpC